MYLIDVPTTTFTPDKCSNVSYSDTCFGFLEVCQNFLKVYHVWYGTGIRNTCFSIMLLFLRLHDKQFIVDYIFCDVFADYFSALFSFRDNFLCDCSYCNNWIYFFCLHYCCYFIFIPWFSSENISWNIPFSTVMKFWYVCTLFIPEVLWIVPLSPASSSVTFILKCGDITSYERSSHEIISISMFVMCFLVL